MEPPRARARGPTDMFGRPLTSNSTQAQPTRNKSVERPKDLEKPTNGVTEDRNKKPVWKRRRSCQTKFGNSKSKSSSLSAVAV